MKTTHPFKIVVALNIGGKAGREYLSGIFRYINSGCHWQMSLLHHSDELTIPVINREVKNGADGFLVGFAKGSKSLRHLLAQPKPIAFLDYPGMHMASSRKDIVFVRSDDKALGRLAAQYLQRCGNFSSYGFLPDDTSPRWSILRGSGFQEHFSKRRIATTIFRGKSNSAKDLESWAVKLKKPAAVFAVSDNHAVDFAAACKRVGVVLPEQLVLVGTDNDELLCNSSRPTISSFTPDHEGIGYRAAQEIDRLMSGIPVRNREILISPKPTPVERESSIRASSSEFLARSALAFIEENACRGISVNDIVLHLHVSRRLAYLRFGQQFHKSIGQVLVETRLKTARKLILANTQSIKAIALLSGFPSSASLIRAFKAKYKTTPNAFRHHGAA